MAKTDIEQERQAAMPDPNSTAISLASMFPILTKVAGDQLRTSLERHDLRKANADNLAEPSRQTLAR